MSNKQKKNIIKNNRKHFREISNPIMTNPLTEVIRLANKWNSFEYESVKEKEADLALLKHVNSLLEVTKTCKEAEKIWNACPVGSSARGAAFNKIGEIKNSENNQKEFTAKGKGKGNNRC